MYYIVYFLESVQQPNKHYIGYTKNLKQRVTQHNQGSVTSTKKCRPWKLIYAELHTNKNDALGREKFLKSGSGWKYLQKQLKHHFQKHENIPQTSSSKTADTAIQYQYSNQSA